MEVTPKVTEAHSLFSASPSLLYVDHHCYRASRSSSEPISREDFTQEVVRPLTHDAVKDVME